MKKPMTLLEELKALAAEKGRAPTRTEHREWPKRKFSEHEYKEKFGSFQHALVAAGLAGDVKEKVTQETGFKAAKLTQELQALKKYVRELEDGALSGEKIKELVGTLDVDTLGQGSDWLKGSKKIKSNVTGIPVLVLSDWHFDEVVKPSQIRYMNAFDREICVARFKHTIRTAIELLTKHMVSPKYDGIVLPLMGDMFSGNIHEELAETNDARINESIFAFADLLIAAIEELASVFGKVFVPCVTGNHGRHHKKPRYKNRAVDNYEWILYQTLARYFKNDSRISFMIPEGPDAQFSIYNLRIMETHGDQFKGGEGIGGIMVPIMRGVSKKQTREATVGGGFDLTMIGHFHQYIHMQSLLINGSGKGYDEFAFGHNFSFERPQQACFIVHPEKGVTFRMPIICDGYEEKKLYKGPSLSW